LNLPHVLRLPHALDINALLSDQHSAWRWQDVQGAALADDVHPYVRVYAQWVVRDELLPASNLNHHANSTAALSKFGLLYR
jgi:hypothetical protein